MCLLRTRVYECGPGLVGNALSPWSGVRKLSAMSGMRRVSALFTARQQPAAGGGEGGVTGQRRVFGGFSNFLGPCRGATARGGRSIHV